MFDKRKKGSAHLKKEEKNPAVYESPGENENLYPEDYENGLDVTYSENEYYIEPEDRNSQEQNPYDDYIPEEDYAPEEKDEYSEEPVKSRRSAGKKSSKKEKSSKKAEKKEKPEKKNKENKGRKLKSVPVNPEADIEDAKPAKKKKGKKLKIILICVLIGLLLIFAGLTYWAYTVSHSNVNLPKVYVDGVFVGGMTGEQTEEALDKVNWDEKTQQKFTLKLPADVSMELDLCEAGAMYSKPAAVEAAYSHGHSGNIYENLFAYISNVFSPLDVSKEYLKLNEAYIRQNIDEAVKSFEETTADASQVVDDDKDVLRFRKGAGEMKLSPEKIFEQVSRALLDKSELLVYDTLENELVSPDFDAIFQELNTEPRDAEFIGDRFEVQDEVVGCTFDVQQAKDIWNKAKPADIIEIPLDIHHPEITGEYLRGLLYRDVLGTQTTYFKGSSDNRKNNIKLAAEAINDVILMPGEVFSYNETVGERTEERGYLPASAYDNGEVVQEVGGGICQVSSNLYCASMFSQMDTVERTNHYFKVSYLDWGMDATVSWGTLDFKFRNSREYPVQIKTYFDEEEESLRVDILGTDVDGSYVEFSRSRLLVFHDLYPDVVIGYTVIGNRKVYDAEGNFLREIEEPIGIYYLHESEIKYPEDAGIEATPDA